MSTLEKCVDKAFDGIKIREYLKKRWGYHQGLLGVLL